MTKQNTRLAVEAAKQPETTFEANGNWGTLVCDIQTGNVVRYERGVDWEKEGDGYDTITRLNADEWRETYPGGDITAGHDILDFGSWAKDGSYVGPEWDWRFNLWHDRESYGGDMWRILPKIGQAARERYEAWLKEQQGNGHASEALDLINRRP